MMNTFKELIKVCDPLNIEDGNGFRLVHEMDMYDEEAEEETGETMTMLVDSEADGVIKATYNAKNYGVSIELTNIFGTSVTAEFKKSELKQFLKLLNASLEVMEEDSKS
jgi:hypothetical protein